MPAADKLAMLCNALDIEFNFGPARPRESVIGFAEAAVARLDPSIDGSPEALNLGFLPIPFNVEDSNHLGVAPIALSRSFLNDLDLDPDSLSIVTMPDDNMAPTFAVGELLLVDEMAELTIEPVLSAFTFRGRLGVGWAMRPERDTVAVFFEHRYTTPITETKKSFVQYHHLGSIAARVSCRPFDLINALEKTKMLDQAREILSQQ